MPKVIIWRDDAVEAEFDPAHRDWRIGRSETNDIALLDPRKSVSRFHAELREENGQWFFIDLNSQNGSWSDGQRVTRLQLRHDTEVSFGDYRLVFVDTPVAAVPPPLPADDQDTTAGAGSAAAAAPPVNPDQTLIMPSSKKDDVPTPPAGAPVVRPKAPAAKAKKGVNPVILVAFLLAMFGAVAAVGYRVIQSMSAPAETDTGTPTTAPPPTPVPVPVTPTPTPVPVEAEATEEEPEATAEAEEPAAKKAAPRRARRPTAPPTPRIPPEVQANYDAGSRALSAQRFGEAIRAFESVLADMPDFRDTPALLAQAREGQQQARAQALADGKRLESAGEWAAAVAAYERANASAEAGAARTKMHAAGDDAYRKARQFDARARAADAIGWYERAIEWLPSSDPRRQTAQERLAELKGGDE